MEKVSNNAEKQVNKGVRVLTDGTEVFHSAEKGGLTEKILQEDLKILINQVIKWQENVHGDKY